jgi:DNA-binding NarL/FixJ family response regulator
MRGPKVRATFVGRVPELQRLAAVLARTVTGQGATVVCAGDAGIGKTRLVTEFTDRAQATGSVVLAGGCVEMGPSGLPYGPFAEALRGALATGLVDATELPASTVDQLAAILPSLRRDAADGPDPEIGGLAQVRLFEAVLDVLAAISARQPVLVVVEDIHWADRSTLDLLSFLVRNSESTGMLVLATVRTDEFDRADPRSATLAELTRRPSVERLDLGALDLVETVDQLTAILGTAPDPATARSIHRRADGNPFFIEQLAWAHADGESGPVPTSLRDILLAQLSQQPPLVQELLGAAAVAGPMADEALLAAVLERSPEELIEPLRTALRARLLVRSSGDAGETYAFRHALLAEATEADLLELERRRLHRRCAEALAARRPDDRSQLAPWAVRVAHHRARSGDVDATIAASLEAAIHTAAVAAHRDALAQYRRAIELLPQTATRRWGDWDVSEVYGRAAACAAYAGEPTTSATFSREAVANLPEDADPWRRGRALTALSEHLWIAGAPGFLDALVEGVRVIPSEPPTAERADALVSLGFNLLYRGDPTGGRRALEEARDVAIACGCAREEASARAILVTVLYEAGEPDAGERELWAAVEALRRTAPGTANSVIYMNLAGIAGWTGRRELGLEIALEGLALAREHGFVTYYGDALAGAAAENLMELGRLQEAVDLLDPVESTASGGYTDTVRRLTRAAIAIQMGDLARAGAEIAIAAEWPRDRDMSLERFRLAVESEFQLESGHHDAAIALARRGLDLPNAHIPDLDYQATLALVGVRAAADLAERARAERDVAAAEAAIETGERIAADARARMPGPGAPRSPAAERAADVLGVIDAERTRLHGASDGAAWARAAAGEGQVLGNRRIYARIRQAEAALADGRDARTDAAAVLRAAHDEATAMGARGLAAMSEGIARRARVDLATARPTPIAVATMASATNGHARAAVADPIDRYGLTTREVEILGLLAQGLTNRQIGEELFISPKTAGVHVSNILGKLEVGSRIQAATIAHRLGVPVETEAR